MRVRLFCVLSAGILAAGCARDKPAAKEAPPAVSAAPSQK